MIGDTLAAALDTIGVNQRRVEYWLGKPCACPERIVKLNQLDMWARRVMRGRLEKAREFLEQILEQA